MYEVIISVFCTYLFGIIFGAIILWRGFTDESIYTETREERVLILIFLILFWPLVLALSLYGLFKGE